MPHPKFKSWVDSTLGFLSLFKILISFWLPSFLLTYVLILLKIHWAPSEVSTHLSTVVAWREKKFKHFVFKSRISKKQFEPFLRKLNFKLFHYKARVQPVSKITTIATAVAIVVLPPAFNRWQGYRIMPCPSGDFFCHSKET